MKAIDITMTLERADVPNEWGRVEAALFIGDYHIGTMFLPKESSDGEMVAKLLAYGLKKRALL